MPVPAPSRPSFPGSSRVAFGTFPHSICAAEKAANTAKIEASIAVDMPLTISGPMNEPNRIPGTSPHTTGHSTAR